jgi:hypothetical protein
MVNAVIRVSGSSREVKSPRLDPGGAVVHVDSRTSELPAETRRASLPFPPSPDEAHDQLRRQYLGSDRRAGQGIRNTSPSGEDAVFQQAGFLPAETVTVPDRRAVERTIDDVVANVFSSSSTAPHLFGDRQEDFEHDMRKILAQALSLRAILYPAPRQHPAHMAATSLNGCQLS